LDAGGIKGEGGGADESKKQVTILLLPRIIKRKEIGKG